MFALADAKFVQGGLQGVGGAVWAVGRVLGLEDV